MEPSKHLCSSCTKDYPECDREYLRTWGVDNNPNAQGKEADSILECSGYEKKVKTCCNCMLGNDCAAADWGSPCIPCADWTDKL